MIRTPAELEGVLVVPARRYGIVEAYGELGLLRQCPIACFIPMT